MKELNIKGTIVLVDDEDFDKVTKWTWGISRNGYACRNHWNKVLKKYERMYMHRYIMDTPKGMDTDHINRIKTDNRKLNLRAVNRSLNNHNTPKSKANTSGFKGVHWFKPAQLWRAYINAEGKRIELGYSKDKQGAIQLRTQAELKYGVQA